MLSMIINTGKITQPFRRLGLMHVLDRIKFQWQKVKYKKRNQEFKSKFPGVALPPDYMLFESFKLDYEKYFVDGKHSAEELINRIKPYLANTPIKILDWGCGPGRIVRHLPTLLPGAEVFGTDYNTQTIQWCRQNIPEVQFSTNDLNPPTPYREAFFDVVYGISIFTHLSEANHHAWLQELLRILKQGGLLYITAHGKAFRKILTDAEQTVFDQDKIVVRDQAKEGHRVFAAFHPPAYMKKLFANDALVMQHIEGGEMDWGIEQDTWILQKA